MALAATGNGSQEGDHLVSRTTLDTHDILAAARRTNLTQFDLRFDHEYAPGCLVNELDHLTGAVAYSDELLQALVEQAGLEFRGPVRLRAWSGHFAIPFDGQDVLVLGRR